MTKGREDARDGGDRAWGWWPRRAQQHADGEGMQRGREDAAASSCTTYECSVAEKNVNVAASPPRECSTAEKYAASEPPRKRFPSKNTRKRIDTTVVTNGGGQLIDQSAGSYGDGNVAPGNTTPP